MVFEAIRVFLFRLLGFAALWLVLTRGSVDEWPLGAVIIVAATGASIRLAPPLPWRLSLSGALHFIPFFLFQSLLGGWDVARRAFLPSMPLEPGFVDHTFNIESEAGRVLFTWIVSLVPGTASVRLADGHLTVHVLDRSENSEEKLRHLERYVAALFTARR